MLSVPMIDAFGSILSELTADSHVTALVHGRVRGMEPAQGDAKGAGEYQAFIVMDTQDDPPHPRLPIQRAVYGVTCYGTTPQNARAVWGAVVKAVHVVGNRMKANDLGIYISSIESGGESDSDPRTNQPLVRGTIRVWATGHAIT